jgi:hypothetical protein
MSSISSSSNLRSAPANWLLGKPTCHLSAARLPRILDALRLVQFYHIIEGRTLPESYKLACEEVIIVWSRAKIPTQRIDSCVRKLSKHYEKYLSLKKHGTRQRESDRMNEKMFMCDMEELFDIAKKDAMAVIRNVEDRMFLQKQREDVFSCSMSSEDFKTAAKENRKRKREHDEQRKKRRYEEMATSSTMCDILQLSSSCSSHSSHSTDEYVPSASTSAGTPSLSTKFNIFKKPEVVGALDRVNLPDRGAVFVAGAVAQALGHKLSDITLSRSSIRRSRRQGRYEMAIAEEQALIIKGPLLLHWDGKMLPDLDKIKEKVDRIAVIVTGNGQEKLLGIPKIERGTGTSQAKACVDLIEKWNLKSQIKGLVFDTTACNTGMHKGACVKIEECLGSELVWVACRHHVMEIVLCDVFFAVFGSSQGPEIAFFKRFQKEWSSLRQMDYVPGGNALFEDPTISRLRQEMLEYLPRALQIQQPRDDYEELLHLSLLFLGGGNSNQLIRAPGAIHHARWMAKAIYVLKIFLFQAQFKLTKREVKCVTDFALFVSLVYTRQWNEAPLAVRAPYNDLHLLSILKNYPNRIVTNKSFTAFSRHLWFLSEHLVGLSFFDDRVAMDTKNKMVKNLQRPSFPNSPRRLKISNEVAQLNLEDLVTTKTRLIFDVLVENGVAKSESFLQKEPEQWAEDPNFNDLQFAASQLKVVNDVAERGIDLVQKYNNTLTKDEEQKQFLLRLVANHRKSYPTASKTFFI